MKTSDFYYELPEELIAQDPLEKRSDSVSYTHLRKNLDKQRTCVKMEE